MARGQRALLLLLCWQSCAVRFVCCPVELVIVVCTSMFKSLTCAAAVCMAPLRGFTKAGGSFVVLLSHETQKGVYPLVAWPSLCATLPTTQMYLFSCSGTSRPMKSPSFGSGKASRAARLQYMHPTKHSAQYKQGAHRRHNRQLKAATPQQCNATPPTVQT